MPNDPEFENILALRPRYSTHLQALRYFHEVARCGSIRLAADHLNVAPSAISRQIRKLEDETGATLFERNPRGMTLTEAGAIYARYARDALLDIRRVRSEIDEVRGLRHGLVRIRTIEGVISGFLSRAVSSFRRVYPGIGFEIVIASADQVVAGIGEGVVDIGLAFNAPVLSGVRTLLRVSDPVNAVMSPDYSLAGRGQLTLAEVFAQPVAIPVRSFGIRNLLDQACREAQVELTAALVTNSIEALRSFARNGDGIAPLHSFAIHRELKEGSVVAVPISAPTLRAGAISICILEDRPVPVAAEVFSAFLADRLRLLAEQH